MTKPDRWGCFSLEKAQSSLPLYRQVIEKMLAGSVRQCVAVEQESTGMR